MNFSKKDTLTIKGLAILFMFAFHCFSSTERMLGMNVNFFPLTEKMGMYISNQLNICVSIFLFLSVYGMTVSAKSKYKDFQMSRIECTEFVLDRYIKLMATFWIPLLFCELGSVLLNPSSFSAYGDSANQISGGIFLEFFGLSELFSVPKHIGTWWYISLAVLTIFILPLLWRLHKKYGCIVLLGLFIIIPPILVDTDARIFRHLLSVPLAICCANCNWLEKYKKWSWSANILWGKAIKLVFTFLVLLIAAYVRKSEWGLRYGMDYPMVTAMGFLVILLAYSILDKIKFLQAVLAYLGRHSGDMFYIHTFFRDIWFGKWLYSFKYAVLIELVLVGVTLISSHFLDLVRRIIRYDMFISWLRRKVSNCVLNLEKE